MPQTETGQGSSTQRWRAAPPARRRRFRMCTQLEREARRQLKRPSRIIELKRRHIAKVLESSAVGVPGSEAVDYSMNASFTVPPQAPHSAKSKTCKLPGPSSMDFQMAVDGRRRQCPCQLPVRATCPSDVGRGAIAAACA